jgi:hypothetical protein
VNFTRSHVTLVIAAIGASLALLALSGLLVYRATVSAELEKQSMANCRAIEDLKGALRDGFADRQNVTRGATLDPSYRTAIIQYYDRQIDRFAALDRC